MTRGQIDRINELGRAMRVRELTPEELEEQKKLRRQYIDEFKENVRQALGNTWLQRPDGTKEPLIPRLEPSDDPGTK